MDIREDSYTIGDIRPWYTAGKKAVAGGTFEIGFSVDWTQHARGRRVLSGRLGLSMPGYGEVGILSLVPRGLEIAREDRHGSNLIFKGYFPFTILEGIEKIRAGDDLRFSGDLSFLTDAGQADEKLRSVAGKFEIQSHSLWQNEIDLRLTANDWLKALDGMAFRRSLFIESVFPYNSEDKDPLALRLTRARDAFDGGRYENCVAEIRHVLAELDSRRGDASAVGDATGKFRNTSKDIREGMSLTERILVLRRTLQHIAHFAHHPGEEEFGRASAKIALVLMASLLEYFPEPRAAS